MKAGFLYLFLNICLFSWTQTLEDIEFGTDSTFDIVTWNIEWFPKNGQATIDSVSKVIKSLKADIIACQEIDDTVLFNTMINGLTDYQAVYDLNNFEGLAYIYDPSQIQVLDNYSIYTGSSFWRPFPRAPHLMKVQFNNQTFIIINNHLKCCGDGVLNTNLPTDEENRRYEASSLLKTYVDNNFPDDNVVIVGDLNDELTDPTINNVFQPFYNAPFSYKFADQNIANGSSSNWSYPSWPSHLDHIIITNELFQGFDLPGSSVLTIPVDDFLPNGLVDYDVNISDHLPVGLKLSTQVPLYLNEFVERNMVIFPNPAQAQINISLGISSELATTAIIITNATGKQVEKIDITNENSFITIPTTSFDKGLYFVTLLVNDNMVQCQKLLIN